MNTTMMIVRRYLVPTFAAVQLFAVTAPAHAASKQAPRFRDVLAKIKPKSKNVARGSGHVRSFQRLLHARWGAVAKAYPKRSVKQRAALDRLDRALGRANAELDRTKGAMRVVLLRKIRFLTRSGERLAGLRSGGAASGAARRSTGRVNGRGGR